jgi:hypothetical protein
MTAPGRGRLQARLERMTLSELRDDLAPFREAFLMQLPERQQTDLRWAVQHLSALGRGTLQSAPPGSARHRQAQAALEAVAELERAADRLAALLPGCRESAPQHRRKAPSPESV